MLKKIITIVLLLTISIFAQNAGNAGLSFLKNGVSARNIALSDIGTLDNNVASIYYNPAVITHLKNPQISFTHQAWVQDLSSEIINANFKLFNIPFAIGVNTTNIGGFEVRTKPTETPDAVISLNYFYGSISTGISITENISIGTTIKYLYESLFADEATGFGFDFGVVYTKLIDGLTLGASVRNLGSMNELRTEVTKLPSDIRFTTIYKTYVDAISSKVTAIGGVQKYLDVDNLHIHLGGEIAYLEQFSLRLGYITGYDSKGLTFGGGILWNNFNFDYAFTPFCFSIGNAHTVTLGYRF
jgi:hypothetical protein